MRISDKNLTGKIGFVFVILFCAAVCVCGQDKIQLDSLELELKNAPDDSSHATTLLNIAMSYAGYDYSKSAEYAQQAIEFSNEKNLPSCLALSNKTFGIILFRMGNYKTASTHFFRALKLYEEQADSMGVATTYVSLGAIQDRLEEYDNALTYYFKAQDIFNHIHDAERIRPDMLPTLYNNIASIYQSKHDPHSALQYYEKALILSRKADNKLLEGMALNNLGRLHVMDLHQDEKGLSYQLEALEVRRQLGDKAEMSKSYTAIANYYLGHKQLAKAHEFAKEAIKLGEEIGSLETQKFGYSTLSEIETLQENYAAALDSHQKFKKLNDSIQHQLALGEITKLQLQYDFDKAEKERENQKKELQTKFIITVIVLTAGLLIAVLIAITIRARAKQTELKQKNLTQDVDIKNKELTTNVMYLLRKNELINNVAERLLSLKSHLVVENQKIVQEIILDLQREGDSDTWKEFELRFNQVHTDFYNKLRKLYPDLSPTDEKLCAFLKLNMSSKEIAAITKQSVKSVEVARARLRKKLNLTNTTSNLITHLANL